jgi:hypothetical protein
MERRLIGLCASVAVVTALAMSLSACSASGPFVTSISSDGTGGLNVTSCSSDFNGFSGTQSNGACSTSHVQVAQKP